MEGYKIALVVIAGVISIVSLTLIMIKSVRGNQYRSLTYQIQEYLGINGWEYLGFDDFITKVLIYAGVFVAKVRLTNS